MVLSTEEKMIDFFAPFLAKIAETANAVLLTIFVFAIIFAALTPFPSLACNPGKPWWRKRGLLTDLCYCFILPFFTPYMRIVLLMVGLGLVAFFVDRQKVADSLGSGFGPLGALPLWAQAGAYLVLSDFLMYWIHRAFHGSTMWRFHAIHHSAEDVDWTTAYRFHPVNLWLDGLLVDVVMLFLGIPLIAIALLAPFNSVTSAYVHANLKWTLGPLKYIFASPVFHRWHHTSPDLGGDKNFGSTFALWDVLFGTFYMPVGELPDNYGVSDPNFPTTFIGQLLYPFQNEKPNAPVAPDVAPLPSPASLRRQ
jgi:sterol desaturase/sphingolipid hydroxylase (fatty acid hydroxylase superfamily)